MLDECKGDKFEELLAVFSIVVLKKSLAKSGHRYTDVSSHHALPLVLSYRRAIQRDLEKRKELDLKMRQQQRNIDASVQALSEEAVAWKNRKVPAIPKNADMLTRLVRENWIGDNDWVDTIMHGVPPTPGLIYDEHQEEDEEDSASMLLSELDSRVRAQNTRLAEWQQYLKTLQQSHVPEAAERSDVPQKSVAPTEFMRHQEISLREHSLQEPVLALELKGRHVALLEALNRDLSPKPPQALAPSPARAMPKHFSHEKSRSSTRPAAASTVAHKTLPGRRVSDASSQGTVTGDLYLGERRYVDGSAWSQSDSHWSPDQVPNAPMISQTRVGRAATPSESVKLQSLSETTQGPLEQFETPRAELQRSKTSVSPVSNEPGPTVIAVTSTVQSDRSSLLERTRQSMSFLTNVLDDHRQTKRSARPNKARHSKSKSMYLPSERRRLERAWSEESLVSAAKDDSFDVDADYESVFKSRPRLAMSPNLSPARNSDQLDADLEDALGKLTINSASPDY